MFGDAGADARRGVHGGVLLLDELLGQAHEGGVFLGGVDVNDIFGVLLRVIHPLAVAQVAQLAAQRAGVPGRRRLARVQPDERLLQLDVVQLHAGVLVKGGVVRREAVGGVEGAPGLLRVAIGQ